MEKQTIKFFYNGLKAKDGKLQKAWYSAGPWINLPADVITITAKGYSGFSKDVQVAFTVENNSDMMTDYFERDRIRVYPAHPLYAQVKSALDKAQAR